MAKKRTKTQKVAARKRHQDTSKPVGSVQEPMVPEAPVSKPSQELPRGLLLSSTAQLKSDWIKTLVVTGLVLVILVGVFYWLR